MHTYYIPNIYFFPFSHGLYSSDGIFCSPSVWNWWVLTERVDARGNENSISPFPVCETKQKSGWIYPDMVHFPLLSNCPANLFFFLSFRLIFESRNELKKKKRISTHAKLVQRKLAERGGGERRRKRENNRGIFNVRKIDERATLCKLWQGLITWRRAVIRSTCFPEFSVKNLYVV